LRLYVEIPSMPSFFKYLAVLLLPLAVAGQDRHEQLIAWHPSYKLTWDDFKATPDTRSNAAATTTTYLAIDYLIDNHGLRYRITCRFSCDKSWGLHRSSYILSHEQGHFDIAEIYARKLHKAMSEYRFNKRTYERDLKEIYETMMQEKEDMQNAYDRETNHSINRRKQSEWQSRIEALLEEYGEYANY